MSERYITGFHAVEERVLNAKEQGAASDMEIFFSKPGPRVKKILAAAKEAGISCSQADDRKLESLVSSLPEALKDHRGIVLCVHGSSEKSDNVIEFEEWLTLSAAKSEEERQTVMVLDSVTDPHNVGAIIRSCDQFGASLMVLPQNRSIKNPTANEVVARSSAGSVAWQQIAVVNNLTRTVQLLKENGFWVYGADAGGQTLSEITFPKKSVIIMGSEGNGMSRLVREQCDAIVSIPTCGKIDSLNVSVAAGVLLYENYRQSI